MRGNLNHITSIGAPKSSATSPAALRIAECRPSQATTNLLLGALLRQPIETLLDAELLQQLERGGMHGVAAKIAQEIPVFSSTTPRTFARARSNASIMPTGPPPTMQQSQETRSMSHAQHYCSQLSPALACPAQFCGLAVTLKGE